jgi:glycosyl transferase family 87
VTRARVRGYTVLIAVSLWSIWLIDMSRPGVVDRLGKVKGTDFIHFYVIGSIARDGAWSELFDARAQNARTQALVNPPPVFIPVESPQTALIMAPVARLPYTAALVVWVVVIVATYALSCRLLLRDCPALAAYPVETIAACAAFPGLFSVVLHGQTSFVGLACMAAAVAALRRGRHFLAGIAIGCLVFKPHWLVAAGAVLLAAGEWRAVAGAAMSAAMQTAVTGASVGVPVTIEYARALQTLPRISRLLEPHSSDSLRGIFSVIVPIEPLALTLYIAAAAGALIVASRTWRSGAPFELRASALVLTTMLVSPHVNTYDLVLLGPVVLLMAAWLQHHAADPRAAKMTWLMATLFVAPLLNSLPPLVRLQLTVTVPIVALYWIRRIAAEAGTTAHFSRGIVAARSEWPIMASPSTSGNASAATPAPSRARLSTSSRSASIAAG